MARRKKKNSIISEIDINLLPDRSRRDYILRFISFIIILTFIIINFFLVLLPRYDYQVEVNDTTRSIYYLNSNYRNILEKLGVINRELFDVGKNDDVLVIESNQLNMFEVNNELFTLQENIDESYIENIEYRSESSQLMITVQFLTIDDLYTYYNDLSVVEYFSDVELSSRTEIQTNEGLPRQKANFIITINPNTSPKVGDDLV